MKTITRNDNNVSIYIFEDSKVLDVQNDMIVVGNPAEFIIADCNANNITVHENVSVPNDWSGWKYFFDGTSWSVNPEWVDPNA